MNQYMLSIGMVSALTVAMYEKTLVNRIM